MIDNIFDKPKPKPKPLMKNNMIDNIFDKPKPKPLMKNSTPKPKHNKKIKKHQNNSIKKKCETKTNT